MLASDMDKARGAVKEMVTHFAGNGAQERR